MGPTEALERSSEVQSEDRGATGVRAGPRMASTAGGAVEGIGGTDPQPGE